MKKKVLLAIIIILLIPRVSAKKIDDLYKELDLLESQKNIYNYLSKEDINNLLNNSLDIELIVDTLTEEVNNINIEITKKEEEINKLNKEIDNIIVFNQISKGENIYLEYIFDASSYSDMIYRYMISEQLSKHNSSLIETKNKEIEELNTKKEELSSKIAKLNNERDKYKELNIILKSVNHLNKDSITSTIDQDIINIKKEINLYQNMGCTRNMDIDICLNIKDGKSFTYPLNKGCVSKNYNINHKGIDLACNLEGTNVYSASLGVVSMVVNKSTYGGNIVYIYHIIDKKKYTTIYGHLLEIKVKEGDIVDSSTVIGLVGGESTAYINGGYDKSTNGPHLHFVVAEGHHTIDFNIYTINPNFINEYPPLLEGYFYR